MQSRSCEPKLGLALRTALSICLILLLPVSTASADEGVRKHAFPWSDSFITRGVVASIDEWSAATPAPSEFI